MYLDLSELATELDELRDAHDDNGNAVTLDDEDLTRLADLVELADDLGGDLHIAANNGVTLIAEADFEDYAREYAESIGAISEDYSWPASYIDWEAAANALRVDYTEIDFNGTAYLTRDV